MRVDSAKGIFIAEHLFAYQSEGACDFYAVVVRAADGHDFSLSGEFIPFGEGLIKRVKIGGAHIVEVI